MKSNPFAIGACLFAFFLFVYFPLNAQESPLDSLIRIAHNYRSDCNNSCLADSNKVNILDDISWELKSLDLDSALLVADQALELSQKIKWKKGVAICYTQKSICLRYLGKYNEALNACEASLKSWNELLQEDKTARAYKLGKIRAMYQICNNYSAMGNYAKAISTGEISLSLAREVNDKLLMGGQIGNLGKIYEGLGDYTKALEYYFESLKITEALGEKRSMAINYSSIGYLFIYQKEYKKALEYIQKGIDVSLEIGDLQSAGEFYSYLATVHSEMKDYPKAIETTMKSLKIAQEINDKTIECNNQRELCNLYTQNGNYEKALEAGKRSLEIATEMNSPHLKGNVLIELGACKLKLKKYKDAEADLLEALKIGNELQAAGLAQNTEVILSQLYSETGAYEKSLSHYKNYIALRDSVFNEESNRKQIKTELNFEFDKKTAVLKEQQEKERLLAEEKSFIQKLVITAVAVVLVIVLFFTYMIFRSLKTTRRQKEIIELKEKEATEQNKIITHQKQLVEEKQREILDSINYAKRIQRAHLPTDKYIAKNVDRLKQ